MSPHWSRSPLPRYAAGVDVECRNCGRTFTLDRAKASKVPSARCLCGVTIDLRPKAFQQQRLGKYLLQRRIAAGGMGEIYYAKSAGVEGFERQVAIKKVLPHLTKDRDFVNMLVKEAKLTVLLHHPNIVQVYDLAKEGDEYYIAMEYVPGINVGNLLEYCREHTVQTPVAMVVHVILQLLKGLAYAHDLKSADGEAMHVLHRDITPQNILITQAGWVKITDFGIAKAKNEISTTSPGIIKGKLGYIAPEQLEGKEPDGRVDIFCAGIVAWEMLTVRRLFKGVDEVDTFRLVSEAKIPSLTRMRQDVTPEIEAAIGGALKKDRDQRYRTAQDFYDALAKAVSPLTVDDCAKAAKEFLSSQPKAFAKLDEHAPPDAADGPTALLTPIAPGQELTITDLAEVPKAKGRGKLPLVLGVALVAVLAVAGAFAKLGLGERLGAGQAVTPPPVVLSLSELQLAVDGESKGLLECMHKSGAKVKRGERGTARLVVASTGGVAKAELVDPGAERWGRAATCLERVLVGLRLRAHSQASFEALVMLPPAPETNAEPAAAPRGGGPPKAMGEEEIRATVQREFGAIHRCLGKLDASAPAELQVKLTVQASGKVGNAVIAPRLQAQDVERCLQTVLRGMRFRASPSDFEFVMPLVIQRSP